MKIKRKIFRTALIVSIFSCITLLIIGAISVWDVVTDEFLQKLAKTITIGSVPFWLLSLIYAISLTNISDDEVKNI